jgi:hypothetical protein
LEDAVECTRASLALLMCARADENNRVADTIDIGMNSDGMLVVPHMRRQIDVLHNTSMCVRVHRKEHTSADDALVRIDFAAPFARVSFVDALQRALGAHTLA